MRVWTLMLKEKPVHRFVVFEGKPITIGRTSEADVVLDNPSISRAHAVVELEKGRDYITDKGSTNGTWVNGQKIKERTHITGEDEIMVGKFTMNSGSIGILDAENTSQSMPMDGDAHTMFVPSAKKPSPKKKEESPSGLGRLIKRVFK
ncbi:MAG: FHA domain-containing protein [Thermodesulfobacteriota bacterium]